MEDGGDGPRWAQEDSGVVWCNSVEALLQAVADGHLQIELGACEVEGPQAEAGPAAAAAPSVMEAVERVAAQLESLCMHGCGLDEAALARLGAALAPTQIRGVGVSNNPGLGVAAWQGFWGMLPRTVAKLDLGDDGLPDEALPGLAAALAGAARPAGKGNGKGSGSGGAAVEDGEEPALRELFLDGNELADVSPLLPLLGPGSEIVELDLGDNRLGDAQALALAQVLPGSDLQTLVLGRNPIGDEAGVRLAYALPASSVETLHLEETFVGDKTLRALAEVLPDTRLQELHLDGCKAITDAGALVLCRALPQERAMYLDIGDNDLSEETAAAIEAALSDADRKTTENRPDVNADDSEPATKRARTM